MDMENDESSPRRKRARRAVASVSSAVKRLAGKVNFCVVNYLPVICVHTQQLKIKK